MERERTAAWYATRALAIALALLFLFTGTAKLLGREPLGVESMGMTGLPAWVRMVVGALQVACALALLVPRTTTFGALALATLMLPATAMQYVSGRLVWLPPLVLGLLLVLAWMDNAAHVRRTVGGFAERPHPMLRDAFVSGAIGAAVVALWFLVIDVISGRPFHTPATLGRALFSVFGPIGPDEGAMSFVAAYTAFHLAAFVVVGLIAALVVDVARREPSILIGFIMLFVATEVGILALVAALDVGTRLGPYVWLQVMAANALAILAMGVYFWRTHAELADEWRHSLDWHASPARPR